MPERWNGEDKSWRFVAPACLMAGHPSMHNLLERAENGGSNDPVICAKLSSKEARHSRQLYHVLVLLVTGRALDKVQGAGEREGAAAWRAVHEQKETLSWSRFTGMLLSILSYRFTGDAQAAIGSFERCIREYEGQSSYTVLGLRQSGHRHQRH